MKRKITSFLILAAFFSVSTVQQLTAQQTLENGSDDELNSKISQYQNEHVASKLSAELQRAMMGDADMLIVDKGMVMLRAFPVEGGMATLQKALDQMGAVECKHRGKYLTAWISLSDLETLEEMTALKSASAVLAGVSNRSMFQNDPSPKTGVTVSQGDVAMLSKSVRERLGVDGTGIRVGIISDSYNIDGFAPSSVIAGDIPGAGNPNGYTKEVVVLQEGLSFGSDEGRAMVEIVHDVAPGAEIYFTSASYGLDNYPDAVRSLADAGCDIIVDDINYFAEPYFQDGILNQVIDEITAEGVTYFTAALNVGFNSYEAPFVDSGVDIGGPWGKLHDFQNGFTEDITLFNGQQFTVNALPIVLQPGVRPRLTMQWDDPSIFANANGPAPDTEMTILLIGDRNGVRTPVAWSTNTSIDNGYSFEFLNNYANRTDAPINVSIAIGFTSGPPPGRIKFINQNSNFGFRPFTGTLVGHANAEGAIAVGAVRYDDAPQLGGVLKPRSFSSAGGVALYLDRDGNPISPLLRQKPDVMGPDGANTSFFGGFDFDGDGFRNFNGTSAAAPHVAAAAALMLEAVQAEGNELNKAQILEAFKSTAIDMTNVPGYDIRSGFGFVQADAAVSSVLQGPNIYRYELVNATNNEVVRALFENDSIDLDQVSGKNVNIRALTGGLGNNGSFVQFTLTGERFSHHSDRKAPYMMLRSTRRPLPVGDYNLTSFARQNYFPNITSAETHFNFSLIDTSVPTASSFLFANSVASPLTISPNPSFGSVSIQQGDEGFDNSASVTVFNVAQEVVLETTIKANSNANNIDFSNNGAGLYFVRIDDGNEVVTKKVMIK